MYSSEYEFEIEEGQATLSKDANNNYNVNINIQGFEFGIQYKNNVIKEWMGVTYTFEDKGDSSIPEVPEDEDPELPGDSQERENINLNEALTIYNNANAAMQNVTKISYNITIDMGVLMSGTILTVVDQGITYTKSNIITFGFATNDESWTKQEGNDLVCYTKDMSAGDPVYTKEIVTEEDAEEIYYGEISEAYRINDVTTIVFEIIEEGQTVSKTTVIIKNGKIASMVSEAEGIEMERIIIKTDNEVTEAIPPLPNPVGGWQEVEDDPWGDW